MRVIAFCGNPNVGKSTIFNALTGMKQHTGNWPGKTVELAQGHCVFKGESYRLVDLPGTYSMVGHSAEERVSAQFLKSTRSDCTVVICDATCLERSLILALQMMAICNRVVICVNLMDEARRQNLQVDAHLLQAKLNVPVVLTSAAEGDGLQRLMEAVRSVCEGFAPMRCLERQEEPNEETAKAFVLRAQELASTCVHCTQTKKRPSLTERLDAVFLHPIWGYATMLGLLLVVFWLTIVGANYPSQGLQWCFDSLGALLYQAAQWLQIPPFLTGLLFSGIYATVARVVSVMLPPMMIFFPLFTLLEDFGYLPRVAFLLDERFRKAGACGKQSLTMCMGLGCNAVGVTGCRIIDSPTERAIAAMTNAFVPCNGKFPALIFLIGMSFSHHSVIVAAAMLTGCIILSCLMTLLASRFLSKTYLRGAPSSFVMELPPYRKPQILRVIVRSMLDRTVFVLGRAVAVAMPAGILIWLLANLQTDGRTILQVIAEFLNTPANWIGLNGAILLAFLLGSPANELVMPILLMILTTQTTFSESGMRQILLANHWTWKLSLCTIVFFLFHWPCTTTLWTIYKETKSKTQTVLAAVLPTAFGILLCALLNFLL